MRVLYGEKWAAAIPVLAIISLYGLFLSVFATTGEVFKAAGRPQLFARMGIFQIAILFALIAALYPFGIVGFALARAGATFIMGWVALYYAGRILELGDLRMDPDAERADGRRPPDGRRRVATEQALATVVAANVFVLALLIVGGGDPLRRRDAGRGAGPLAGVRLRTDRDRPAEAAPLARTSRRACLPDRRATPSL